MLDGILHCLNNLNNLSFSINFRVGSKRPVTFKTKLYVTTVNNSFQPLPIFCHKELHLRSFLGHELNILKRSTKILKGIGHTHHPPLPMIECNLEIYEKLTFLDAPKIHLQKFFTFNIKWSKSR